MKIISKLGICKDPTSFFLEVAGAANFDDILNLKNNLVLDSSSTIEASASSNTIAVGSSTDTTDIQIGAGIHAKNIVIGNDNDSVTIKGTVTQNNSVELTVEDKLITLNKGGAAGSAGGSGIEFEENSVITGFIKVDNARQAFSFNVPDLTGTVSLKPNNNSVDHTITSLATVDRTWSLPDTSDTFAGLNSSQTFFNKTLSSATLTGTTTINNTMNVGATANFSGTSTFSSTASFTGSSVSFSTQIASNFIPNNNSRNLGSATQRWSNVYANELNLSGNAVISGNIFADGDVTLGNAISDSVSFIGRLSTDFLPNTNNARRLGSSGLRFSEIWTADLNVSSNFTVNNLQVNGATDLGNSAGDTVSFVARVDTDLLPNNNFGRNLGSSANSWNDLYADRAFFRGNISVNQGNTTGGGIILSDDGDIVDLNNGYLSLRFSNGVQVYSAQQGGSPRITLDNTGNVLADGIFDSKRFMQAKHLHFFSADNQTHGQGGILRWNMSGAGRTNFLNNRGLGAGGFNWRNSNGGNGNPTISANYTDLMSLNNIGDLFVAGKVDTNSGYGISGGSPLKWVIHNPITIPANSSVTFNTPGTTLGATGITTLSNFSAVGDVMGSDDSKTNGVYFSTGPSGSSVEVTNGSGSNLDIKIIIFYI